MRVVFCCRVFPSFYGGWYPKTYQGMLSRNILEIEEMVFGKLDDWGLFFTSVGVSDWCLGADMEWYGKKSSFFSVVVLKMLRFFTLHMEKNPIW